MEILLYIAAIIFAIAFAGLVIVILMTWKSARDTQKQILEKMDQINDQVNGITTETTTLLQKTNQLADDVDQKSIKLNTLFEGVQEIGTSIQSFNNTVRNLSSKIKTSSTMDTEEASKIVKWGNVLMDLWEKKKKKE